MKKSFKFISCVILAMALSACANQNHATPSTSAPIENAFELKSHVVASDLHGMWAYTVKKDGVEGINMSAFAPDGEGFDLLYGKDDKGTEIKIHQSFTWTFDEKTQLLHEKITELTVQGKKEELPEPQTLKVRILTIKGQEPAIEFTETATGEKMTMFRISDQSIREILQIRGKTK